jgi:ATP-dependent DNA ligase
MEALSATELPASADWQYEPKWDGFRCLAFRDHQRIDLLSKAGKPLTRYFPELVYALATPRVDQFVLDGEIVTGGRFRHGTKFLRWRPDKTPRDCTFKQVERESRATLTLLDVAY